MTVEEAGELKSGQIIWCWLRKLRGTIIESWIDDHHSIYIIW